MTSSLLRFAVLMMLATLPLCVHAAETSYRVVYTGGTLSSLPLGRGVRLYIDATLLRLVDDHLDALAIPVTAITSVSVMPQGSSSLTSLATLGHAKRSTIAITWSYETRRGGMALHCSAAEYEGILAALRGVSMRLPESR